ncbi:unnamed protein product [Closterium sp. NIES-65]|nr:unnamed protein product [Closterium sp. NIES-65]
MEALASPPAQACSASAHSSLRASSPFLGGGGLRNAASLLPLRSAGLVKKSLCRPSHAVAAADNNQRPSAIRAGSNAPDDAAADALCRRQVLGALAIAPTLLMAPRMAVAEEAAVAVTGEEVAAGSPAGSAAGDAPRVTEKVFLDIAVDGAPVGRLVIGVYGKAAPVGAARFAQLAKGVAGVSYRRKDFLRLTDSYVQGGALRSFSLTGSAADPAAFVGGLDADAVAQELQQLQIAKRGPVYNKAYSVALFAVDPTIPPPKQKLVARGGKFEMVEEALKPAPNGTEFAVSFTDCPELDSTHLVVGRVLDGFGVLEKVREVPFVRDGTDNGFFKAAKLIGDTRATVAERGFYRPYKKITITKSVSSPSSHHTCYEYPSKRLHFGNSSHPPSSHADPSLSPYPSSVYLSSATDAASTFPSSTFYNSNATGLGSGAEVFYSTSQQQQQQQQEEQEQALYPVRPGEKECAYYMRHGKCSFGATCRFHHPPRSSSSSAAAPSPSSAPSAPSAPSGPSGPSCPSAPFAPSASAAYPNASASATAAVAAATAAMVAAAGTAAAGGVYPSGGYSHSYLEATRDSAGMLGVRPVAAFRAGGGGGGGAGIGGLLTSDSALISSKEHCPNKTEPPLILICLCSSPLLLPLFPPSPPSPSLSLSVRSSFPPPPPSPPSSLPIPPAALCKRAVCVHSACCSAVPPSLRPCTPVSCLPACIASLLPIAVLHENWDMQGETDCAFYLKNGRCKFGRNCRCKFSPNCRFNHPEPSALTSPAAAASSLISQKSLPSPFSFPTPPPLRSCKFSQNCRFNHPEPSALTSPAAAANAVASARPSAPALFRKCRLPSAITVSAPTKGELSCDLALHLVLSCTLCYLAPCAAPCTMLLVPSAPLLLPILSAYFPTDLRSAHTLPFPLLRHEAVSCAFYIKTGTCKYGVTCKFDHPPPGEVAAKAAAEAAAAAIVTAADNSGTVKEQGEEVKETEKGIEAEGEQKEQGVSENQDKADKEELEVER